MADKSFARPESTSGTPPTTQDGSIVYSYEEARRVLEENNITSRYGYFVIFKTDKRLPSCPVQTYKRGGKWRGWKNFLSSTPSPSRVRAKKVTTKRKRKSVGYFCTYEEAQAVLRKHKVLKWSDYLMVSRQDKRLPRTPQIIYEGEWKGWRSFAGPRFYTYHEWLEKIRELGITSLRDYYFAQKQDRMLPTSPELRYKGDWKGWKRLRYK
jgi:hypothetical protein